VLNQWISVQVLTIPPNLIWEYIQYTSGAQSNIFTEPSKQCHKLFEYDFVKYVHDRVRTCMQASPSHRRMALTLYLNIFSN
jgi:hypothetical protein